MSTTIAQHLRARTGVVPQDITTLRTGAYLDASGAQRIMAAVTSGALAANKKVTVAFLQAKDAAGTGAKALGASLDTIAPAGGGSVSPVLEAKTEDLDTNNGFKFVAVTLVSDNGAALYGAAVIILGSNRYNP